MLNNPSIAQVGVNSGVENCRLHQVGQGDLQATFYVP
jgi:hypothetical protein